MTTPEEQPPPNVPPGQEPKTEKTGRGDAIALGIGCAVFLIMLIAIVLVGLSGR